MIEKLTRVVKECWQAAENAARHKAVDAVEEELEELEYIFALLTQGTFIGMPSPPAQISMDLLPLMEKDLILLLKRINTTNEPLSRLFSVFDVT